MKEFKMLHKPTQTLHKQCLKNLCHYTWPFLNATKFAWVYFFLGHPVCLIMVWFTLLPWLLILYPISHVESNLMLLYLICTGHYPNYRGNFTDKVVYQASWPITGEHHFSIINKSSKFRVSNVLKHKSCIHIMTCSFASYLQYLSIWLHC